MRQDPWAWRAGMAVYRLGMSAFFMAGGLRWLRRKYNVGLDERMGQYSDVPQGGIWVHAVSVGEVQSASALIKRMLADSQRPCLLSTVTPTGREMAERLLGGTSPFHDRVHKIYSPWDKPAHVASALETLKPSAYIVMETELWPEMLAQLKARGIPAFLANGRISDRSFPRLRRQVPFWRGVLSCFTHLMVRFEEDRERFLALGAPPDRLTVTGDCKVDTLLDRRETARPEDWAHLRRDGGPLLLAGSTHPGEEEVLISAFCRLRRSHPDARLVIVPRHPERALMAVAAALPHPELRADLLSHLRQDSDVVVVDRIGVLFDLYAAADAAFVGGSLVPKGGQNPFEPVLFGTPMTHGPDMSDFPDTERMDQMGAARCVHNDLELAQAWEEALTPSGRERMSAACRAYFDTLGGAAGRTWEIIKANL